LVKTAGAGTAGGDAAHTILSLGEADAQLAAVATGAGLRVLSAPPREDLLRELASADIVVVHFWNSPELYELLRSELPPMRLVVWCWVRGTLAPQVLTRQVIEFADGVVAVSPETGPGIGEQLPVITPSPDVERLADCRPRPHAGFNIGYVGTVGPEKLHPRFVEMSAAISIPDARFIVCGLGDGFRGLARRARALGVEGRFELRGYVERIASVLSVLDVFGYPLCQGAYVGTDVTVLEAMFSGVPPVVLGGTGLEHTIEHGRTGLIAADEQGYIEAVEALHRDARARLALGRAAAEHARAHWSPGQTLARTSQIYSTVLRAAKRERSWPSAGLPSPPAGGEAALWFVESLGSQAGPFITSLLSHDPRALLEADEQIANSAPVLASAGGGGVLHYRIAYPGDAWLRLWSGLIWERQGRRALALAEFTEAGRRGLSHWRVDLYRARAARALGQADLADLALAGIPPAAAAWLQDSELEPLPAA
jgi:glycosyltransferase involved in cell wall biosynthesis